MKWKNIDFDRGLVVFRRHFSGSKMEVIEGRKSMVDSNDRYHSLSLMMTDRFKEILKSEKIASSNQGDEFVFKTKTGKPLYEGAMRKAWNSSCERLGVKIPMYVGLKHSTMTYFIRGFGD